MNIFYSVCVSDIAENYAVTNIYQNPDPFHIEGQMSRWYGNLLFFYIIR